jgi:hypothetical protein
MEYIVKKYGENSSIIVVADNNIIDALASFLSALAKNTPTSLEQCATPAVVKSVCVQCGKPMVDFKKGINNCCDECWLCI